MKSRSESAPSCAPAISSSNAGIRRRPASKISWSTWRLGLEEFQPSLIVMDSISSIEHASSEKGFRQFIIGVASILRGFGRSALLTQTVLAGAATEHTAPYLSTIADAILTLDYAPAAYELNRTMRVVKMR